jgi:tetratricopeptide (TPR) repeat protein
MNHSAFQFTVSDDGIVYCPDVVTDAVEQPDSPRNVKAAARSVSRFAEAASVEKRLSFSVYLAIMFIGAAFVFLFLLVSKLSLAWFFPENQIIPISFTGILMIISTLPVLLLGFRFRSDERRLLLFFLTAIVGGHIGYYLMIETTTFGFYYRHFSLGIATSFFAVITFLAFTDIYQALTVRLSMRPLPTTANQFTQLALKFNLRSLNRKEHWIRPIMDQRERGWLWVSAVFAIFLSIEIVAMRLNLRWTPKTTLLALYATQLAYQARPYRYVWESFVIIGAFIFSEKLLYMPSDWSLNNIIFLGTWVSQWVFVLAMLLAYTTWLSRRRVSLETRSLFVWKPIYQSQPLRLSLLLPARAISWLALILSVLMLSTIAHDSVKNPYGGSFPSLTKSTIEYKFARIVWTRLLSMFPNSGELEYRIGIQYLNEGYNDAAVDHLKRAKEFSPPNHSSARILPIAAYRAYQDELATISMRETLSVDPEQPEVERLDAALLFMRSEYNQSIDKALNLIAKGPKYSGAWKWVILSLVELDECERINQIIESLKQPGEAALLGKGRCERALGHFDIAASIFKELALSITADADTKRDAQENLRLLNSYAQRLPKSGALVYDVHWYGEAAATRTIRTGDIITAVDGIKVRSTDDVNRLRTAFKQRSKITWTIIRNGEKIEVDTKPVPLGILIADF